LRSSAPIIAGVKLRCLLASCFAVVTLCLPHTVLAQRALHWESVEVDATLDSAGNLRVAETQTMAFTGDWNGGERRFNIRPRQKLTLLALRRAVGGGWRELTEDADLDDIDDYAWTARNVLRWRSRQPADPPFSSTIIRYQLRYELTGVLLQDGDGFLLDHDFLFAERDGMINRFALRLMLDSVWQPKSAVRDVYTAERLPPGRGFVLTLPLQYTGAGVPAMLDTSRPNGIVTAVWLLLGVAGLAVLWLFVREHSYGRFAPLTQQVDEAWLRDHILKYPAEVVGAAWDEGIDTPEVVALIARMVSEGKLESEIDSGASMTLRLKVDRKTLEGHERTLVERLFFDGRTATSTEDVKDHYRDQGFNPADEIRHELEATVGSVLPDGRTPRAFRFATGPLLVVGGALLLIDWYAGNIGPVAAMLLGVGALLLTGIASAIGQAFRANIHWGPRAALACLIPALSAVTGAAAFLWYYAGLGIVDVSLLLVWAMVALALLVTFASTDAMKSRQHCAAIAFRKTLAAGRAFFTSELGKEQPALRDEWFPWILAFGLGPRIDDWSARRSDSREGRDDSSSSPSSFSSTDRASSPRWTGFGGGRSGGAGAGASWASAAGGMAVGVAAPSSSGSSGGGSSGGSSGSSGSSGGGGGGGW
jgi:hypothetical protein